MLDGLRTSWIRAVVRGGLNTLVAPAATTQFSHHSPGDSCAEGEASMLSVSVKVFASLRRFFPCKDEFVLHVHNGGTAQDVIRALSIPDEEVYLVVRNGAIVAKDAVLADGDALMLFPIVPGG